MEINDSKLFEKCNRYSTLNISNGCTISDDILNKINIESISQSELNEQYVDYGMNKLIWIFRLREEEYQFKVLLHSFCIHVPHPTFVYNS